MRYGCTCPSSSSTPTEIAFSPGATDAFGRQRVAEPHTLFDSKQIFDNQPLFWDDQEVSGSGTGSAHSVDRASTTLSVSATTAGKRVRQTFRRFNYQPGKSQLALMTGVFGASGAGIKKRLGLCDDDNGLFFQVEDGVVSVGIRSNVSGGPVETIIEQSNWNLDTFDDLDIEQSQIFVIDFEWLGVGTVRYGFVVDGEYRYVHAQHNANLLPSVYISTPNLPLRYEIENDGTGAADTFEHICTSVISEGGLEEIGRDVWHSTGGTHVDANVTNTIYAVVGVRLKPTHFGATVIPGAISIASTTNDYVEWILIFNPNVAGTFTYSAVTNSALEVAKGATANVVTGGLQIGGGFGDSNNVAGAVLQSVLTLGAAIDGTPDELVLCARPLSGNLNVEGGIALRELQ